MYNFRLAAGGSHQPCDRSCTLHTPIIFELCLKWNDLGSFNVSSILYVSAFLYLGVIDDDFLQYCSRTKKVFLMVVVFSRVSYDRGKGSPREPFIKYCTSTHAWGAGARSTGGGGTLGRLRRKARCR